MDTLEVQTPPALLPGQFVTIRDLERAHVEAVLVKEPNLDKAARILGIDICTLYRKRRRWGMPLGKTPRRS